MLTLTIGDIPPPREMKNGVMRTRIVYLTSLFTLILGVTSSSSAGLQVIRIHDGRWLGCDK
jgi:hypothetical protein